MLRIIQMDDTLYCFSFNDLSENGETVPELLTALGYEFSSWRDAETGKLAHTLYFKTRDEAETAQSRFKELDRTFRELDISICNFAVSELRKEDWAESWKIHFKPIEISATLAITPSWINFQAKPGQHVIVLDPGMSFGTGQHATTYYCLKTIDRLAGKPGVKSMLDAGCGSGILTIAAALRGYDPVDAFDNDPDAVRIAAENLALNRIGTVSPVVGDAAVWQGRAEQYDLVCANILGHLLVAFRNNIVNWVRPGGYLTLAGILSTEFDGVAAAFIELGFEELDRETLREWTSGLFRKR